jgi:phosphate:Na+ symporter
LTGGPLPGRASGAAVTALVQSSSATVLTTIGFVSAGLLTFAQAVGVIFGASLGTTSTGWIVSLVGLKLNITAIALPAVGVGALLRLLGRERIAAVGLVLAGFGLIFVGIDLLRDGMADLSTRLDPGAFPGSSVGGRLLLVAIGVVMTVVTQSSSAAVATTLTALHAGTIGLEQAAALVVGQSIGTTLTALLAAVGASVAAKRTAAAHILFNGLTGALAFLLIPAALRLEVALATWAGNGAPPEPAMLIAAFHTGFTLLGVVLLLPFVGPFSRAIERAVPERGPRLTRHLDPTVVRVPAVAVETARRAVREIAAVLVAALIAAAERPQRARLPLEGIDAADAALDEVRRFLAHVHTPADAGAAHEMHLAVLHAVDHLERLVERLRAHTPRAPVSDPGFDKLRLRAAAGLAPIHGWLAREPGGAGTDAAPVAAAETLSSSIAAERRDGRAATLARAVRGDVDAEAALTALDATRWLDSSLYHVWRTVHHLA